MLDRVVVHSFEPNRRPRVYQGMVYLPVWVYENSLTHRAKRKSEKYPCERLNLPEGLVIQHYISLLSLSLNQACHDALVELLLVDKDPKFKRLRSILTKNFSLRSYSLFRQSGPGVFNRKVPSVDFDGSRD